jgi:DNA-binding transcriptional MocR family regulator
MLYGDPLGDRRFRETLAAYLRTSRGVRRLGRLLREG